MVAAIRIDSCDGLVFFRGELLFNQIQVFRGFLVSLAGGLFEPGGRLMVVTRNALPMVEHHTEVGLCIDEALLGSLPIPADGDGEILVEPFVDFERIEFVSILRYELPHLVDFEQVQGQ